MGLQAKVPAGSRPARGGAEPARQRAPVPAFADARPGAVALRKLAEAMNGSPRVAAQRKLAEAMHRAPPTMARRGQTQQVRGALRSPARALQVVQREPITEEQALQALQQRAAAFYAVPHEIIKPWGDDDGSNCHGYTVNGEVDHFMFPSEFLEQIGDSPAIVFVRTGWLLTRADRATAER